MRVAGLHKEYEVEETSVIGRISWTFDERMHLSVNQEY